MDIDTLAQKFEGYHGEVKGLATKLDGAVRHLEGLEAKMNRAMLGGVSGGQDVEAAEAKAALGAFLRGKPIEGKAMSVGVDSEGGFAVPQEIAGGFINVLKQISPVRSVASVLRVSTPDFQVLINKKGMASGWKGETTSISATSTPTFGVFNPGVHELYAMPQATQRLIDDAVFDVESFVMAEVAEEFAFQEGAAHIRGDGVLKPQGFLTRPTATTADATRPWGTLQYVKTGGASGFASSNPGDALINLLYSLRSPYRAAAGVAWMMTSTTLSIVRQWKDGQGNYLWQPSTQGGQPGLLLGYPVVEANDMDELGANKYPVAFGNWREGYLIVDRVGLRVLRDPYSVKGSVQFYSTMRTGGGVRNYEAIKLLKCEA